MRIIKHALSYWMILMISHIAAQEDDLSEAFSPMRGSQTLPFVTTFGNLNHDMQNVSVNHANVMNDDDMDHMIEDSRNAFIHAMEEYEKNRIYEKSSNDWWQTLCQMNQKNPSEQKKEKQDLDVKSNVSETSWVDVAEEETSHNKKASVLEDFCENPLLRVEEQQKRQKKEEILIRFEESKRICEELQQRYYAMHQRIPTWCHEDLQGFVVQKNKTGTPLTLQAMKMFENEQKECSEVEYQKIFQAYSQQEATIQDIERARAKLEVFRQSLKKRINIWISSIQHAGQSRL